MEGGLRSGSDAVRMVWGVTDHSQPGQGMFAGCCGLDTVHVLFCVQT